MTLRYSLEKGRYLSTSSTDKKFDEYFAETALLLTRSYGYDINMVEFVLREGQPYVINSTNPVPMMDKRLMMPDQFNWCVDEVVNLAIERAKRPLPTPHPFQFNLEE